MTVNNLNTFKDKTKRLVVDDQEQWLKFRDELKDNGIITGVAVQESLAIFVQNLSAEIDQEKKNQHNSDENDTMDEIDCDNTDNTFPMRLRHHLNKTCSQVFRLASKKENDPSDQCDSMNHHNTSSFVGPKKQFSESTKKALLTSQSSQCGLAAKTRGGKETSGVYEQPTNMRMKFKEFLSEGRGTFMKHDSSCSNSENIFGPKGDLKRASSETEVQPLKCRIKQLKKTISTGLWIANKENKSGPDYIRRCTVKIDPNENQDEMSDFRGDLYEDDFDGMHIESSEPIEAREICPRIFRSMEELNASYKSL